jgi:hypothetical protein
MKKTATIAAGLILLLATMGTTASPHHVRGHGTCNGNYLAPHHQTNADRSTPNNWSTKGNPLNAPTTLTEIAA